MLGDRNLIRRRTIVEELLVRLNHLKMTSEEKPRLQILQEDLQLPGTLQKDPKGSRKEVIPLPLLENKFDLIHLLLCRILHHHSRT